MSEHPPVPPVALVARTTVRKLRIGVVVAHVALLVLPAAFLVVVGWFAKPEVKTIKVAFYDPKFKNIVSDPSPLPGPSSVIPDGVPNPAPPSVLPTPPTPPSVAKATVNHRLPPMPTRPVRRTALREPKVKVKPRPRPKAEKKPAAPSRTEKKPTSEPDLNVYNPNAAPLGGTPASGTPGRNIGLASGTGSTAPGGSAGNSAYEGQVAYVIKQSWNTPESVRLGQREPRVTIELVIEGDGTVRAARLAVKSGVLAMDESVSALLANLRKVPAPPDGKRCEISFIMRATRE